MPFRPASAGARSWPLVMAALSLSGCTEQAGARSQLVVVVDTDAPVPSQLASDPELSGAAAVDTLRVDVFERDGTVHDYRDIVATDPDDWPVSFGIVAPGEGEGRYGNPVRLRIRAFRGALAADELLEGKRVLEPPRSVSLDRVVDLAFPESGVRTVLVRLSLDCLGRSAQFLEPIETCIDAERIEGAPTDGLVELADASEATTAVGSAPLAKALPCAGAPEGAICIPGGLSVLGDDALLGLDPLQFVDAQPLRPVLVSPFAIDRTEVTVGAFRKLVKDGTISGALVPWRNEPPARASCTFPADDDDDAYDALPLTCVTREAAEQACKAWHGSLPTEAQWEHAARGRGAGRTYPWGDESPQCCTAGFGVVYECAQSVLPPPAGSHTGEGCDGPADVSRDGVLDLGGSVAEMVRDAAATYDAPCWTGGGFLVDPVCDDASITQRLKRGGDFEGPSTLLESALRRTMAGRPFGAEVTPPEHYVGFRCVYPLGSAP